PVSNSKEIFAAIEQNHPNLIILDTQLSGENGFNILQQLKEHKQYQATPVLILSDEDSEQDFIKGLSLGAVDYITKPFESQSLTHSILEIIEHSLTKIFIADSDKMVVDFLKYKFDLMGYKVESAYNGVEALERIKETKPNLILLDSMMTGIDGIALLKKIKANYDLKEIPVIILSAKKQENNIIEAFDNGAHDYITKPIKTEELIARSAAIINRNNQSNDNTQSNSKNADYSI
ncbi:MAG: response regulator, partial [Proteobacteria bacterium]|nr:response regulator [Pseudomonadota bacterium]